MSKTQSQHPHKKKLITKKNRSAWAISIVLILLMSMRLAAGFLRPYRAQRVAAATAVATATPDTPLTEEDKASSAMTNFFKLLAEQRYEEAVTHFGSNYETLAAAFPDDASDHAALLHDACRQQPCQPVHSVHSVTDQGEGTFAFAVTFAGSDGRLLTKPAGNGGEMSEFTIMVANQNGRYLVQNLP